MYPKISIVTVSYNQAQYIESTIKSVLQQNYPNLEYIIIDGGSTDGSQAIIEKYKDKLTYYISEKDKGMYDGLNKGFKMATGEIMAWINSDDIYIANSFYVVADIFSKFTKINWLTGCSSLLDEKNRIIKISQPAQWSKYKYYLGEYKWIQQESVFWRRSLWEKAGSTLNASLELAGDLELWLRFFKHEKLYTLNAPLGCFRLRSSGQKTLEFNSEYAVEAETLLKNTVLTTNEKATLNKIKNYRKLLKIPFLRSLFPFMTKHQSLFEFPEQIEFERKSQEFTLK